MKGILGILLVTAAVIKEVQGQCTQSCLLDAVCNITTQKCDCNTTYYRNKDLALILQPLSVTCTPASLELKFTNCQLDALSSLGFRSPPNSSCYLSTDSSSIAGQTTLFFGYPPRKATCDAIISITNSFITYVINVLYNAGPNANGVVLYNDVKVGYNCSYALDLKTSLGLVVNPVVSTANISITGAGSYTAKMALYKSSTYTSVYTVTDYPITLNVGQPLYVGTFVQDADSTKFALRYGMCYATPSNNASDSVKYNIIVNGCPTAGDVAINITLSGVSTEGRFSVRIFKFPGSSSVYLHCSIVLCRIGNCSVTCPEVRVADESDSSVQLPGLGPIKIDETESSANHLNGLPWLKKICAFLVVLVMTSV
ncbi:uromodulin-like [Protopterus annectens]|uniref:uromodulin-like n=1 Tax=Protopterus annectens TaxID=7888 RepID=UPI001CFA2030|nr:uromodulin-like [Protopterus annectens]